MTTDADDFESANPHQSVSNGPSAAEESHAQADDEASTGTGEAAKASGDYESVAGYHPPAEFAGAEGIAATERLAAVAPSTVGLRDIGEASFGPGFNAEIVHGADDRVRIANTAIYPWRAIASLLITARDNSQWIGTGWFIGPHTLATAGHVVYIKNSGVPGRDGWVKRIVVMPGRNGSSLPYGSVASSNFRSVVGWTSSGSENYDYAAIILPNNLGSTTGWFGYGSYSDATLKGKIVNIAGYPGDKPSGTLWYGSNRIASLGSRKVYYDIDTAGGQSGAPVYRIINGSRYGVAVHAYGGATTNSGTRITKPVFDNYKAWKA